MNKLVDIVSSWLSSFNPTKEQLEVAEYRASVCDGCQYKEELNNALLSKLSQNDALLNKFKCGACGCVLSKKLFSQFKESCPQGKWQK